METLAKAISSGSSARCKRKFRCNPFPASPRLHQECVKQAKELDAKAIAAAMEKGVETAYKAVMKPKEGTILTVAREAAAKAVELAETAEDLEPFFQADVRLMQRKLWRGLRICCLCLKEAGVVDSGGQGLLEVYQRSI